MSLGGQHCWERMIGGPPQPSDLSDQLAVGRHAENREAVGPGLPLRQAKRRRQSGAKIGELASRVCRADEWVVRR
jgi:hypothetical protein